MRLPISGARIETGQPILGRCTASQYALGGVLAGGQGRAGQRGGLSTPAGTVAAKLMGCRNAPIALIADTPFFLRVAAKADQAAALALPTAWRALALPADCIPPMLAALAVLRGESVAVSGQTLLIGGRVLIGQAGKTYGFASEANARRWAEIAAQRAQAELKNVMATDATRRAAFLQKKGVELALLAERLLTHAAKLPDEGKQAALIAESQFCTTKWDWL